MCKHRQKRKLYSSILSCVRDLDTITPRLGITNRTNQSYWFACLYKYQPIRAWGSDLDAGVCMKVRFKSKVTRGFSLFVAWRLVSPLRGSLAAQKNLWDQINTQLTLFIFLFYFIGFPLQKGRHQFTNHPSWAEDQCETIQFEPFVFYPLQKIFIQLTVNHVNYSDPAYVHEATTPWVESVNSTQFTACVTRTGRNDYPSNSFATVDWVAYQGAPPGGIAGEKKFSRWWTGTSCQTVTLPSVSKPSKLMSFNPRISCVYTRSDLMIDHAKSSKDNPSSTTKQAVRIRANSSLISRFDPN